MTKLDTRKEELLKAVVREHARTAEPVASDHLKGEFGVSSATVRAEMAALEREGYLRQPHTSAGRVPTEVGYRYYVANCLEEQDVDEDMKALQKMAKVAGDAEVQMKQLARSLAQELSEGVFIGFAPQSTYYTGLAYLFAQPEFSDVDLMRQVGDIIDNLDGIVARLFDEVAPGVRVYVGSENPFGEHCGTVLLRAGSAQPMMGVLGPMRMDYDRMVAMMRELEKVLWTN